MNARALAVSVLSRVEATDAFLNLVLDAQLSEHELADERDAALVTELCYGATRRRLTLDHAISRHLDRKLETLEPKVLSALRLGAYQLYYMRVPKHAAVSETVEALKALKLGRATGLVNAVLRKLAAFEAVPLPPEEPIEEFLSIKESHPAWLVRRWVRQFGRERAQAMLEGDNQPAPLCIRVNSAKLSRAELLEQLNAAGVEAKATELSSSGILLPPSGKPEELYGYAEGFWQVQDEAAQLVGQYASIPAKARVLDACAAPGGKACHLAERGPVVALELHENKLRKISVEAKRLGLLDQLTLRQHDATTPIPEELGKFDAVVVDAPCSGLGTLRRHPELRYRRTEEDIHRLAKLQRTILERCQQAVAPGGLLIYAVCSTEPQEGVDQIDMFLRSHPDFSAEPPASVALPLAQGFLQTLPGPQPLDGFFAARLRRLSEPC